MASLLEKNGKRRWRARVMVDGVRRGKWFPDDSRRSKHEAIAWEEKTRAAMEKEAATPTVCCPTVFEWLTKYLDMCRRTMAPRTYREEKQPIAKAFVQFVGADLPVDRLLMNESGAFSVELVRSYLDEQAATRSGNAANKERKNLRAAWEAGPGLVPGWPQTLPVNPFDKVRRYPEVRHPRYVPPAEDFWAVYNLTTGQDRIIMLTLLHLAARKGEIFSSEGKLGLRVQDLFFKRKEVRLWTRKRGNGDLEPDLLPMSEELIQGLAWWLDTRKKPDAETVFYCEDVGDAEPNAFEWEGQPFRQRMHWLNKMCQRAGVRKFDYHSIRHFTARHLYEKGYPIQHIQRVLRHKSPKTTELYLMKLGVGAIRGLTADMPHPENGRLLEFPVAKRNAS